MHTLGHDFIPDPIHAGGLRYHGMSPLLSHVYELGLVEAEAIGQIECFEAGVQFARTEGIVPAPEPTHAIAAAIREARRCTETGEAKVILTALCGHGHFDMAAYDAYFRGELADFDYPEERVRASMARVPVVAGCTPAGPRPGWHRATRPVKGSGREDASRRRGSPSASSVLSGSWVGCESSSVRGRRTVTCCRWCR